MSAGEDSGGKPTPSRAQRWLLGLGALAVVALVLLRPLMDLARPPPAGVRVVLWHSQRGAEREALEALLRKFNEEHLGRIQVEPLSVPDASFKDKLLHTVPRGSGPDLFVRPHNELGELSRGGVLAPVDPASLPFGEGGYVAGLVEGVSEGGVPKALPLTYKALFVFYNTKLLPEGPPASLEALEALRASLPEGSYPLAYDATSLFFHAPFFLAAGGRPLGEGERFLLFDEPGSKSFALPGALKQRGVLPPEVSYAESIRLFEDERVAALVCGPWYTPAGKIAASKSWDVGPLFSVEGKPTGSFVTVEAAFLASSARHPEEALEVARYLAGPAGQADRYRKLGLPPVERAAYAELARLGEPVSERAAALAEFQRRALESGLVTPSSVRMAAVWRPAEDVLRTSLAGRDLPEAIDAARYTLAKVEAEREAPASAPVYGALLVALLGVLTILLVRHVRMAGVSPEASRARQMGSWGMAALPYMLPGALATVALVLAPVTVAAGMSLFEFEQGRFVFVGLSNFRDVLLPPLERAFEARSFYFALGVTVLWTVLNVLAHVTIGLSLAMMLRPAWVKLRTPFRLLLILPWAIPNYITALMWKGMFHAQVGAINALLEPFGFAGYAWFDRFSTAFFANLVTNTWLGFPFMMVVTLGALSSIPKELEEAATLDGASRWLRFKHVVLPHVRPALLPSIVLGSVWTFNMFNVVYLVSAGEPGSQTDILVSEAYRWAFERGQRYGYAASYSVLIFLFLLGYTRVTRRLTEEKHA